MSKKKRIFFAGTSSSSDTIDTSLWMIPYADLMSNMMILFLALFAFSYATRSPQFDQAMAQIESEFSEDEQKKRQLQETQLAVDLETQLRMLKLDDFGVRVTSRYIHLTLPSPVLFRQGSELLSRRAKYLLSALALVLTRSSNPILVEGHTDNIPPGRKLAFKTNWELSAARAFSVIDFFVSKGLSPARFQARGYGEYRPVASNDTAAGRRSNRRIEIRLVRAVKKLPMNERAPKEARLP